MKMSEVSTRLCVSNELLLDELRRRLQDGWLPGDPSYVVDLILQLDGARNTVASEIQRQVSNDWQPTVVRAGIQPKCDNMIERADAGSEQDRADIKEIYEWLRGQGYSSQAACQFIQQLPEPTLGDDATA